MTVVLPRHQTELPSADAGFTILELLVTLALAAMMMAAIPGAIRLGTLSLNRAETLTHDAADRAAVEFIAERLSETLARYERGTDGRLKVAFTGEAQAIGFVAPATMDPSSEAPAGVFLMQLALVRTDVEPGRIMLRWQPFRPGSVKPLDAEWQERVLLDNVAGLSFRYFGAPAARIAPTWSDVWTGGETIPELVEIEISRGPQSSGMRLVMRVPLRLRPSR
jgi:prepilin-type N-terminal cleavage/methylation domain-containing protein